jgi:hypothetical protein
VWKKIEIHVNAFTDGLRSELKVSDRTGGPGEPVVRFKAIGTVVVGIAPERPPVEI